MAGRLAVDFGTSNTIVAVWDHARKEGVPLHVPHYGRFYRYGEEQVSVIPSLIHYGADRSRWIGAQVIDKKLAESERTFRWMKRYISNRSPRKARFDGREITYFDAGKDFLSSILLFASAELNMGDEEICLTVPVEAFEHYENWLTEAAEQAGMPRFRLIDEPFAAALGYGAHIQPGDVYLIFDFGGGTLDVAVVLIEQEDQAAAGRRCRVLGKAGEDIGGMYIDQWIFQEVLRRNKRSDSDDEVRKISNALLVECEKAKEDLSNYERATVSVMNPNTGAVIDLELTRRAFDDLLDQHEVLNKIDRVIRRALNAARDRGYAEDRIKSVLMVGGSSLIPSVQNTVQRIFGRDSVMLKRPLDAIARGAAAFVAGVDFYDYIQHDYAIRHREEGSVDYEYRTVVEHGTSYPTSKPVARLTLKATYDGQIQLGIAIFEVGEQRRRGSEQPMELVFAPSGTACIMPVTIDEEDRRNHFWMNEGHPTFLTANPPGKKDEPCFQAEFGIDGNKRLLLTATDLRTGRTTHRDYPVVKLT